VESVKWEPPKGEKLPDEELKKEVDPVWRIVVESGIRRQGFPPKSSGGGSKKVREKCEIAKNVEGRPLEALIVKGEPTGTKIWSSRIRTQGRETCKSFSQRKAEDIEV